MRPTRANGSAVCVLGSVPLPHFVVALSACGSPTTPSSTFTLTGDVVRDRQAVAGASVTIMDGIYAGHTRTTAADGTFSFTDLAKSSFTLRAVSPTDTIARNIVVNLTTTNQRVEFDLTPTCSFYPGAC